MIKKKKKCINCEKESYIWSKNLCKICFTRLNPPKKIKYKSSKQNLKDIIKKKRTKDLHIWFLLIWDKRREKDKLGYFVRCLETGQKLYEHYYKFNTCCYHHLFEKSTYPEYEFNEENLVIIHPDIHTLTHNNIDKTPRLKNLKESLILN